ncbi:MAG: hypothetical protein NTY77_07265 [Elusimicrobia bacterium]|nr:hypothetical protein [Elusimicrobiota bacterium]
MIEHAVFVADAKALERLSGEYGRLYFGNEFCSRLLPDAAEVDAARRFARTRGMAFTLVTPYADDEGLAAIARLLEHCAGAGPELAEAVINDWGVFRSITEGRWKGSFIPVLGRLLTKQKRDPRIPGLSGIPVEAQEYFRSCNADSAAISDFLTSRGVGRLELDNLPQGLLRTGPLKASLYVPFGYITTTRLCFMAGADERPRYLRRVVPCARECRAYTATLSSRSMGQDIILKGNTQFFVNRSLPDDLEGLRVDRLVHQPVIPM